MENICSYEHVVLASVKTNPSHVMFQNATITNEIPLPEDENEVEGENDQSTSTSTTTSSPEEESSSTQAPSQQRGRCGVFFIEKDYRMGQSGRVTSPRVLSFAIPDTSAESCSSCTRPFAHIRAGQAGHDEKQILLIPRGAIQQGTNGLRLDESVVLVKHTSMNDYDVQKLVEQCQRAPTTPTTSTTTYAPDEQDYDGDHQEGTAEQSRPQA